MDDDTTSTTAPQTHALAAVGITAGAPTVGTPTLHTRVVPDGWVPLDAALAWVAFGDAVDLSGWNRRFYLGASLWMEYGPETFLPELRAIADRPDQAGESFVLDVVAREARRMFPPPNPNSLYGLVTWSVPAEHRAAAARKMLADTGDEAQGRQMREAMWRASNDLRRAIASGAIKAFGYPGHDPEGIYPASHARERIPPDVCTAPVTLGQGGIWPFALGDYTGPLGEAVEKLWHEILIDAPELLRAFPAPDDGAQAVAYHLTPAEKPARGGRPPHVARKAFTKAMMQRANSPDGLGDMPACTRAMIEGAAAKFGDRAPSETTIREWVREDWPED